MSPVPMLLGCLLLLYLSECLVWQMMVETHWTTNPGSGEGVSIDY